VFAFLPTLGTSEMFILLVLGLLLFGRNLPDVGRQIGRTVAQLRRGLQDFKDQMERDADVRELKQTVSELKRAAQLPDLASPTRLLRDLTDEALSSPPPAPPPAQALELPPPPQNGATPTSSAERGPESGSAPAS